MVPPFRRTRNAATEAGSSRYAISSFGSTFGGSTFGSPFGGLTFGFTFGGFGVGGFGCGPGGGVGTCTVPSGFPSGLGSGDFPRPKTTHAPTTMTRSSAQPAIA